MNRTEISAYRIQKQQLVASIFSSPRDLVANMGAMQAQDFSMVKWAVGQRLQQATEKSIEAAYNAGHIIRTHLMRPTWHLVSANDIYWLLELTAPRIKTQSTSRHLQLELSDTVLSTCYNILERELNNHISLTREELAQIFESAGIRTNDNRLSHILMSAELESLICSGPLIKNKITYALLSDRVPVKKTLSKEESLHELAKRYFGSHGPATLQDFVWWSGLSVSDARKGLEMNKANLLCETFESETYWFSDSAASEQPIPEVLLLPAFDELLISYRDRSAIITDTDNKKAISDNGIFRPIVVVNGEVRGIWRRLTQRSKTLVEVSLFQPQSKQVLQNIEHEARKFSEFIEKPTQLIIKDY